MCPCDYMGAVEKKKVFCSHSECNLHSEVTELLAYSQYILSNVSSKLLFDIGAKLHAHSAK
jgi:hypothetical protein